jgi:hypothetical protein
MKKVVNTYKGGGAGFGWGNAATQVTDQNTRHFSVPRTKVYESTKL